MRRILIVIFVSLLSPSYAQKGTELNGTWVLDSVVVKNKEMSIILYDKLEIDSGQLTRTIVLGKGRWKASTQAYKVESVMKGKCADQYNYKIEIKGDIINLRWAKVVKCCANKCFTDANVLGKFMMLNDVILIEQDGCLCYYHLERTC